VGGGQRCHGMTAARPTAIAIQQPLLAEERYGAGGGRGDMGGDILGVAATAGHADSGVATF